MKKIVSYAMLVILFFLVSLIIGVSFFSPREHGYVATTSFHNILWFGMCLAAYVIFWGRPPGGVVVAGTVRPVGIPNRKRKFVAFFVAIAAGLVTYDLVQLGLALILAGSMRVLPATYSFFVFSGFSYVFYAIKFLVPLYVIYVITRWILFGGKLVLATIKPPSTEG